MDYFFDTSAAATYGGDFDFSSQTTSPSMMTSLPDFSGGVGSSCLDPGGAFSFYGASTDPSVDGAGFPASSDASSLSATETTVPDAAADGASAAAAEQVSSSSSSSEASTRIESPSSGQTRDPTSGSNEGSLDDHAAAASSSSSATSVADSGYSDFPTSSSSSETIPPPTAEETDSTAADSAAAAAPPEEPTIDINVNNVVCSFSVRCHLNLRKVALEGCNTEYNRERAMVCMKLRNPRITASIWNSGKITCIGATSENDAKKGARRVARILSRMGMNVHFCRFRVVNVLASCTMPFAIRLHKFSEKYPKQVEYEPELHPGATYKIKNPKASLKIFSTGSITITAPVVSHIQSAVEHIYPRVKEFRMDERDKESGEMANLVPKAFVPLNTKHGRVKLVPKGPFHSKYKQVIHQQDLVKRAIQQVKDIETSDDDPMYMGYDDSDEEC